MNTLTAIAIFVCACLVVSVLLWIVQLLPLLYRQHRYQCQGRPLNDWLRDYDFLPGLHDVFKDSSPKLEPANGFENKCALFAERKQRADAAVRSIGPDAIPWLLDMLKPYSRSPGWYGGFAATRINLIVCNNKLTWEVIPLDKQRQRAIDALVALGPQAAGVIPALEKLIEKGVAEFDAASALREMGEPGINSLNRMLSHPALTVKIESAVCLATSEHKTRKVAEALVEGMHAGDAFIRNTSASSLSHFPQEADIVVPALLEATSDIDPLVRGGAALALSGYKAQRTVIEPRLEKLRQEDKDEYVRELARVALEILTERDLKTDGK